MTYDEYTVKVRARMKKLVRAENFIKKYRFLIIAVADILFIAFIFTMYFAGSYMRDLSASDVVYGDEGITRAVAFLSDVKYKYTENGTEKNGLPYGAGEYEITAETNNPFGVVRQQKAALTVYKRKAYIGISDFTTEYGNEPDALSIISSSDLASGDTIAAAEFSYDKYSKSSKAKITSVTIQNRYGNDVTSSYDLQFGEAEATVTPRAITVDTGSAEKKYDGSELKCAEYEITSGSLAYDDMLRAGFSSTITLPGTVSNKADIKIFDKNGTDVTEKYMISERIGSLNVYPLQINIKTGSAEKEYDGEPLYCREYEITSSELINGHQCLISGFPEITEPGSVYNTIKADIRDENGDDANGIYSVNVDRGILKIKGRKITLKSNSSSVVYDGEQHDADTEVELVSGKLYDGDSFMTYDHPSKIMAKKYKNTFAVSFSGVVPDGAYDITYEYGTFAVTERPLLLTVTVHADKERSSSAFVADLSGETAKTDVISTPMYIPYDTDYNDFEEFIDRNLTVTHSAAKANTADSYDITYIIIYDEEELDEFRAEAEKSSKNGGAGNGNDQSQTVSAEDKYGPSGIGSDGEKGGDKSGQSRYADIPAQTPDTEKTAVGSVKSLKEGAVYLRLRSFGNYTGDGWTEPAVYEGRSAVHPLNMTYSTLVDNGYSQQNDIEVIYNKDDGLVPVPYYALSENQSGSLIMTDVAVPNSSGGQNTFYYRQIPVLSVSSLLSLENTGSVNGAYRSFVYENYLSLPENTKAEIKKIIEQAGLDASSPSVISDVAGYVRHVCAYSGAFEQIPDGEDKVIYFLTKSKEGVCGHFASAATLIYRALGIPARYTVGYYVAADGRYAPSEFYDTDAHAWVEVFVDGVGWIPVEVTSSAVSESGAGAELQPPDTDSGIFYNRLYYQMSSVSKTYDGEELYSDSVRILSGSNLREGDAIHAKTKAIKYTGVMSASSVNFAIYDENGNDVTLLYDVTEVGEATVEITPRTVDLPDIDIYVGQTVTKPSYDGMTDKETAALLPEGFIPEFNFDYGTSIKVEGDTLTGISAETGRELSCFVDLGSDGMYNGDRIVSENDCEIIFIQKINVLPFDNVRIKKKKAPKGQSDSGVIRTKGENGLIYSYIAVRSDDAEKSFDGQYLRSSGIKILSGALEDGHTLEYESGSYQLYVGSCDNTFSRLRVLDGSGADVTGKYIIDFYPGKLTVLTGEYNLNEAETEITVDERAELDGIEWTDSLSNVNVTYAPTGDKPIVRIEKDTLIGISPGVSHISATIHGADLNGDGVNEFSDAQRTLTVNVMPKKQAANTGIYIAVAVSAAVLGFALTLVLLKAASRKKEQAEKYTKE